MVGMSNQSAGDELNYHVPVMVREVVELLVTDPNGLYVDGTIGGGGHAAAIVARLQEGKLIGFDRDPEAIAACRGAFGKELTLGARSPVELVLGSYLLACSREDLHGRVHGILLDLGVSSHQLDAPARVSAIAMTRRSIFALAVKRPMNRQRESYWRAFPSASLLTCSTATAKNEPAAVLHVR